LIPAASFFFFSDCFIFVAEKFRRGGGPDMYLSSCLHLGEGGGGGGTKNGPAFVRSFFMHFARTCFWVGDRFVTTESIVPGSRPGARVWRPTPSLPPRDGSSERPRKMVDPLLPLYSRVLFPCPPLPFCGFSAVSLAGATDGVRATPDALSLCQPPPSACCLGCRIYSRRVSRTM